MAVSNEEKMLKERIRILLAVKGKTASDLADPADENAKKRYQRQVLGEALVPYSTIFKLLYEFHDISPAWLVMGEGVMKRKDETAPRFYTTNNVHDNHNGGDINIGPEALIDKRISDIQRQLEEVTKERDMLKGLFGSIMNDKPDAK